MYQYFGLIFIQDILNDCSIHRDEQQVYDISQEILSLEHELSSSEILVATAKAIKIKNEYDDVIHAEFEEDYDSERGYGFEAIEYNDELYELWKKAVKLKRVVKLFYNSISSGMSTRLVDPYKSSAPYGEGYCGLHPYSDTVANTA